MEDTGRENSLLKVMGVSVDMIYDTIYLLTAIG
jgi:hypothetical protein